jgi:hypothetical protein
MGRACTTHGRVRYKHISCGKAWKKIGDLVLTTADNKINHKEMGFKVCQPSSLLHGPISLCEYDRRGKII